MLSQCPTGPSRDEETELILFCGCEPAVLCRGGKILAVGADALALGDGARRIELEGDVLPGLGDAHVHLDELVQLAAGLELRTAHSVAEVVERVGTAAHQGGEGEWLVGRGWDPSGWLGSDPPHAAALDRVSAQRPVCLFSKDEHSVWVNSKALRLAGIDSTTPDPRPGRIERDGAGVPTGLIREAGWLVSRLLPEVAGDRYREALAAVLGELAQMGLCSVHTMDPARTLVALQELRRERSLPLRVVVNLPAANLEAARQTGVCTGWGDDSLRIWGVKAFMDGSLGSGTAEMSDGSGLVCLTDAELRQLIGDCVASGLNLCLHAIGDRAVHRALSALNGIERRPPWWRPRIEHAQCVAPADVPLFLAAGAVASMQPLHAVADRRLADQMWGDRTRWSYAWGVLDRAGVPLAFGSDAPVESADPLRGLEAATDWRRVEDWHPELALDQPRALAAYSRGVAYAAGLEGEAGELRPGFRCDLTVVESGRVVATVVGGRVVALGAPTDH